MRILFNSLMGDGGGGGAGGVPPPAQSWRDSLPPELKGEASLTSIPDVATLAKGYVHAQRLVGTNRIPAPQPSWTDKEWNEFYSAAGRPEKPDGYKLPADVKFEEGLTFDEQRLNKAREAFHKAGLSARQAEEVLRYYVGTMNEQVKGDRTSRETAKQAAVTKLQAQFGSDFNSAVELARSVVTRFGGEELVAYLNETGLGNDPRLVTAMHAIGKVISEDTPRGGTLLPLGGTAQAVKEINRLTGDQEFMKALDSRDHPNHRNALETWETLHKAAYPGKVVSE